MEFNTTPSNYGDRGAGGKFKKPPAKKTPATPYDRPPPSNQPGRTGWLSKLVNPAYRIISGSANRILPSFISNAIASTNPPPLELIHDEEDPETVQDVGNDEKPTSSYVISRSTEGEEGDPNMGKLTGISEVEKSEEEKLHNSSDNAEVSRIEQLMQGKSFSRDEIMRLTEILKSRVVDEQENKTSRPAEGDTGRLHLTHETPRKRNDRKQDETHSAMPGTSTPLPQTNVQDEVGASPIDIARAYMGSRRLEKGFDPYGLLSKGQQAPQNRFLQPPSPKSSTCWPAAMVQDQHGCFTPQYQRGYGIVDFPRTPYSRTLLSKSRDRTQSQVDNRWPDLSAKPFQQSQSSIYSQEKTRTDLPHLSYGSVGPIRRMRNKFGSESRPRRSIFMNSTNASSPLENVGASKVSLPAVGKNLEVGQTSGVEKYQSVEHRLGRSEEAMPLISSSNETVRKILEQLDRHKPTPAEKAAELKLASEWKRYPRSEISEATPNDKLRSSHSGEFGVRKNNGMAAAKSSKEGDIGVLDRLEVSQEQSVRAGDTAVDDSVKASSIPGVSVTSTETYTTPSFMFTGADPEVTNSFSSFHIPSWLQDSVGTDNGQKDKGATPPWPFHNQSNGKKATTLSNSTGFELRRNVPGQASGAKPNLASISVKKSNPKNATFPDNGFGFTFPVPASAGALSEPPTPSIMPSTSVSVLSQPLDASTNPVYNFGTGKSAQRLIFSFPSTSNAAVREDASDLKFSFGGDRKSRISFSSVGKATC